MRFPVRMSEADASLCKYDHVPVLRSHQLIVWLWEGALDRARMLDRVDVALDRNPRLSQRFVRPRLTTAPPRWVDDPTFDLAAHLRFLRAPGDGSIRALLDWVRPMALRGFDATRPAWELVVVEGLAGDLSALVYKKHHSTGDGVAGVQLDQAFFDQDSGSSLLPALRREQETPTGRSLVAEAWRHEARSAAALARRTSARVADALRSPGAALHRSAESTRRVRSLLGQTARAPSSPVMRGRSADIHFDWLSIPVHRIRAGARAAGGTVNDGFLAAIAGGMRRYHEVHGQPVDELRVTVPISMRAPQDYDIADNRISGGMLRLPLGPADPAARVQEAGRRMRRLIDERAYEIVPKLWGLVNRTPSALVQRPAMRYPQTSDLTCSNVLGTSGPASLAGAQMRAWFAFSPRAGSAANITMLRAQDRLDAAINLDPAAVTDPGLLVECLGFGFDEISALA